jgi:hypothetical protein
MSFSPLSGRPPAKHEDSGKPPYISHDLMTRPIEEARTAKLTTRTRKMTSYNSWGYVLPPHIEVLKSLFISSKRLQLCGSLMPTNTDFVTMEDSVLCSRCLYRSDPKWGMPPVCSTCGCVFECGMCHDVRGREGEDRLVVFGTNQAGERVVVECPFCCKGDRV